MGGILETALGRRDPLTVCKHSEQFLHAPHSLHPPFRIFVETLSRIFARMMQQGLIEVEGPRINITDQSGLEALATGGKPMAGP